MLYYGSTMLILWYDCAIIVHWYYFITEVRSLSCGTMLGYGITTVALGVLQM